MRVLVRERAAQAAIVTGADLWDTPEPFGSLIYPVPQGGERSLKIDTVEQAYHALAPHGLLAVLSPYEKDLLFPQTLKKVFGKAHAPMQGANALLWCQRGADRPRRRHEVTFQVRVNETMSARFVSRPGVFTYGRMDDGARALVEAASFAPGQRVLDLGCGCGTNGVFSALLRGEGFTGFIDSNLRAVALAELNARANSIGAFEVHASARGEGFPPASFDVVLANPPYFAQSSIAERFIDQGKRFLKPGGVLYVVTRQVNQVAEMMRHAFTTVEAEERRGYVVFRGAAE